VAIIAYTTEMAVRSGSSNDFDCRVVDSAAIAKLDAEAGARAIGSIESAAARKQSVMLSPQAGQSQRDSLSAQSRRGGREEPSFCEVEVTLRDEIQGLLREVETIPHFLQDGAGPE